MNERVFFICIISLLVFYLCLFLLYQLRASRFLRTREQRFNTVLTIFYLIVPNIMVYFLIKQGINGDDRMLPVYLDLLAINATYFIFGILEEIRLNSKKIDKAVIIHHVAFALVIFILIWAADYPSYINWIMAIQNIGVFLFAKKVFAEIEGDTYSKHIRLLSAFDFWGFFLLRVVAQTILTLYVYYFDIYLKEDPHFILIWIGIPGGILSLILNYYWFSDFIFLDTENPCYLRIC